MKIVCISDTHEQWHNLVIPECDVLISAGDYSYRGKPYIVEEFHKWLSLQPAKHVISVQGNHELWVEKNFYEAQALVKKIDPRIHFLRSGSVDIDGVKFYGDAATPEFMGWAFMIERGEPMKRHWEAIPLDTQVLITHGPCAGILDINLADDDPRKEGFGCKQLRIAIERLHNLKLHVFGHIHGSSGEIDFKGVHFINAAICDEDYRPNNPIRIFELKNK